jgi:RNA polymerase sigma-70 factor (ECF subfamily)
MENKQVFELLGRIAQKDESAFRELYKAFSRKIYAYVLNQVKDPSKAEEIVADTLYDIWRAPLSFRGESQFSTWVIGIARNKVLLAYRARKPDSDHDDIDELSDALASEDASSFDVLAERQRREGVQECMGKLPEEQRECLHLVFYEGYSLAEVAEAQGCPEGTVKTRLFHARQRLRNCLRLLLEREGTKVK